MYIISETYLFGTLLGALFGILSAGSFLAYQHWHTQPATAKLANTRPPQKQPTADQQYASAVSN